MRWFSSCWWKVRYSRSGLTTVEYVILLALVALAVVLAVIYTRIMTPPSPGNIIDNVAK